MNLLRYAQADQARFWVRPVIAVLASSFLCYYYSIGVASAWLVSALILEALSFLARNSSLQHEFARKYWLYGIVFTASLIWVAHAVLLWRCEGIIPHVATVMDLVTVALYGAIGSYHSRLLFLNLVIPQLATLCVLLISYLVVHAPPLVAIMASLATIGACGTILMNCHLMHQGELKLRQSNADLARLNAELAELAETAQAASQAKSTFLANMSHEIRTPLNGVLGMAQAMTHAELSPAQRSRLAVIKDSGDALLTVLNDILDVAKIESGRLELEALEFDLASVVSGAVSPFQALADAKGVALSLTIDPDATGTYRGDPTRLRQVLFNLVSNALKFTERGAAAVIASREGERLKISVSDTGIGIPEARRGLLFQPFTQVDPSTTRRFGGTGLGLAISNQLVSLMGGEIEALSQVGEGSTFTLSLPLEFVGRVDQASAQSELYCPVLREDPDLGGRQAVFSDGRVRILAAEDNQVNRLVLETILSHVEADLTVVNNGAEAVEAFETGRWDLILMDIQMPVMDGLEAVRRIRALEAKGGTPPVSIVAITANAMSHQVAEYLANGFQGHVAKPIEMTALFNVVASVLNARPKERVSQMAFGVIGDSANSRD